jgi:uncharacterized protein YggT (Ycf19 family)
MEKAQIIGFLIYFVDIFRDLVVYAFIARVIISMFVMMPPYGRGGGKFYKFLCETTDPILNVVKKIPHKIGMFDFSPMIAIFGLDILGEIVIRLLAQLI